MAIKEHIVELADKIDHDIHFDPDTNVIKEDGSFEKHLPDGLTMSVVDSVGKYNTEFVAASALSVGRMAIEQMKKHKTIETISAEFKMGGKDTVSHVVNRDKTFTNPADRTKPVLKHGSVSSVYSAIAGKNSGQLEHVRSFLHSIAAEELK